MIISRSDIVSFCRRLHVASSIPVLPDIHMIPSSSYSSFFLYGCGLGCTKETYREPLRKYNDGVNTRPVHTI